MKIYKIVLAFMCAIFLLTACNTPKDLRVSTSISMSDPLPLAPELLKRTLPNGLTTYIRENWYPGQSVTLYLAVAVGSANETDEERGYAHFIEHMAFNGTKNYPENDLVAYFRSIGMEFGAEVNAYTSYEDTVYKLQMETDQETVETAVSILREWATSVQFDPIEVEKEKGIIIEEMRSGFGQGERARENELATMLKGSKYANRDPIGTENSIRNATAEKLKAFYLKHYRPENMAVIVVGDVSPSWIESMVSIEFNYKNSDNKTLPRTVFPLVQPKGFSLVTTIDENIESSQLYFQYLEPYVGEKTIGEFYKYVKNRMALNAIQIRLSDITRSEDVPWEYANYTTDYFFGRTRLNSFSVVGPEATSKISFDRLTLEIEKIKRFGFTESEFRRMCADWKQFIRTMDVENHDILSENFAEEYVRNFMYGEPVPGVSNEKVYHEDILSKLTLAELNSYAKKILTFDNGFIAVRDVSSPELKKLSVNDFIAGIEKAKIAEIPPLTPSADPSDLFDNAPLGATIVSEKTKPDQITELLLSNGARIILKPTNFDEGVIKFQAIGTGGYYRQSPEVQSWLQLQILPDLYRSLGYANFTDKQLVEMTAGMDFNISWNSYPYYDVITGTSNSNYFDDFLRYLQLVCSEPGKDVGSFNRVKNTMARQLKTLDNSPGYNFQTSINQAIYGKSKRTEALDIKALNDLTIDDVIKLHTSIFSNASNFTYVFVGDFNVSTAKRSIAKYIGAIPQGKVNEDPFIDVLVAKSNIKSATFSIEKENRAAIDISFNAGATWSKEDSLSIELFSYALQNYLLDLVREELGGTYTLSCNASFNKLPIQEYNITISFNTDPKRVDEIVKIITDSLDEISLNGLDKKYTEQIYALVDKSMKYQLYSNTYWMQQLAYNSIDENPSDIKSEAGKVKTFVTVDNFNEIAKKYLNKKNRAIFIMLPEQK